MTRIRAPLTALVILACALLNVRAFLITPPALCGSLRECKMSTSAGQPLVDRRALLKLVTAAPPLLSLSAAAVAQRPPPRPKTKSLPQVGLFSLL